MITKELLSEVLDVNVLDYRLDHTNRYIVYDTASIVDDVFTHSFNIYELAHKCKEWAYNQGYPLTIIWANNIVHVRHGENRFYANKFDELDGVLQACEWILKQKDNK